MKTEQTKLMDAQEINLSEAFISLMNEQDKIEVEKHKHRKGIMGGSGGATWPCVFHNGVKAKRIKNVPIATGLKAHKGAMWSGTFYHQIIQNTNNQYFRKIKIPGCVVIDEIYNPILFIKDYNPEKLIKRIENERGFDAQGFLDEKHIAISKEVLSTGLTRAQIENMSIESSFLKPYLIEDQNTFEDLMIVHPELFQTIGRIIMSPIDYAVIKDSPLAFVFKPYEFRNETYNMPFATNETQFVKIWDIKSAGDWKYWKVMRDGPGKAWRAQFNIYCKAANLPSLTLSIIHKEKMLTKDIDIMFDSKIWDQSLKKQENIQKVKGLLEGIEDYSQIGDFNSEEMAIQQGTEIIYPCFDCLDPEAFVTWCPMAVTHEEEDNTGKPRVVLDKPCPPAMKIIERKALLRFGEGSRWKRGWSHITINRIENGIIYSTNKSGKQYQDSLFAAYKSFKDF